MHGGPAGRPGRAAWVGQPQAASSVARSRATDPQLTAAAQPGRPVVVPSYPERLLGAPSFPCGPKGPGVASPAPQPEQSCPDRGRDARPALVLGAVTAMRPLSQVCASCAAMSPPARLPSLAARYG